MSQPIPIPGNAAELEQVLLQVCIPNTEIVKQATKVLNSFSKKSSCVVPLLEQLSKSARMRARQMAGVLLRRRIAKHFNKLTPEVQEFVKTTLLQRLNEEQERLVRNTIAALVSTLAKILVPEQKWPEVLVFLLSMTKSDSIAHKSMSMVLFRNLVQEVGHSLRQHFPTLQAIFVNGLQTNNECVQTESLKALGEMASQLEEKETALFKTAIPHIVLAVRSLMKRGDDAGDAAVAAFEVFQTLAECAAPVLNDHLPDIIKLILSFVVDRNLSITFRENAAQFVVLVLERKPKRILQCNLLEHILRVAFTLFVEPIENAFEAESETPQTIGVEIMDAVFLKLPAELVFQPVLSNAKGLLKSANYHERKAGAVIMAVMAEGCAESLLDQGLDEVLSLVFAAMKDEHRLVRAAACVCLSQFAEYLQPDIIEYHKTFLPHLVTVIDASKADLAVMKRACEALDSFAEHLGPDVHEYIQPLMQKLFALAQTNNLMLQPTVITTIKSIAVAAEAGFAPYYRMTLDLLVHCMQQTDDDHLELRARATECCGAVLQAVGQETAKDQLPQLCDLVFKGFGLDYIELREAGHNFFGFVAVLMGEDFAVMLPTLVPLLIASLESDDGVTMASAKNEIFHAPEGAGFTDSEDEDDDCGYNYSIRTVALDEKMAALNALSTILCNTKKGFLPYLTKTLEHVSDVSAYPHPGIRASVGTFFQETLKVVQELFVPEKTWKVGQQNKLSDEIGPLVEQIVAASFTVIEADYEFDPVFVAFGTLSVSCELFGLDAIGPHIQQLKKCILDGLTGKLHCQEVLDEDHDVGLHNTMLDHVVECIRGMAMICGGAMKPFLDEFMEPVAVYFNPERHAHDRAAAIGCFADVADGMGSAIRPYVKDLMRLALQGVRDKAVEVRRNSAFCLGTLCKACPQECSPFIPQILDCLAKLYEIPKKLSMSLREEFLATRDNAVSALAKVMLSFSKQLPLENVVKLFLTGLPLQQDHEESKYAYPCLAFLFTQHPEVIVPHLPAVVHIVTSALCNKQTPEDAQKVLAQLMRTLIGQYGQQIQQAAQNLPRNQQEVIQKCMA